jgi:hypothetical protein
LADDGCGQVGWRFDVNFGPYLDVETDPKTVQRIMPRSDV